MKGIMRIKFLRNCRGYEKDKIVDVDFKVGQRFINKGFARLVPQRGGIVNPDSFIDGVILKGKKNA